MSERVALFMQDFAGGGAERVMTNLANRLSEDGLVVDLVVCREAGPLRASVGTGVRVVSLDVSPEIASLPRFVRYVRRERPRVVLSALSQPNTVAAWARRITGVRTVLSIHNQISVEARLAPSAKLRLVPMFMRRFAPWADAVVACSNGVADDFAALAAMPRERITTIYNPVVFPTLFERAAETPDDPWLAPGAPPVVLGVGRLNAQKNWPNLLEAFALLAAERPDVRLLILGEGEDRASLEALVAAKGLSERVRMPGFVANPPAFMRRAAVLAVSSDFEGLPTVLIEGIAVGANIVSADCPSGPNEILGGGRYGRLVPVRDPAALKAGIAAALDSPRPEIPDAAWFPYRIADAADAYRRVLLPGAGG